jgi:hypothetical protein
MVPSFQPLVWPVGMASNIEESLHESHTSKKRAAQKKRVLGWGVARLGMSDSIVCSVPVDALHSAQFKKFSAIQQDTLLDY